ncbi:MAG TPA: phospholipid carrier-dependent glycosyltransferase [Cyanothece sp. UBA12306]|nr:phospholipid carrier-dependent glycosyltransferase [Cyanothece sp. UBA12306]
MDSKKPSLTPTQIGIILGLIWLVSNLVDQLWLILDHSAPAWDQSNHLVKSLQYLNALDSSPQFLDGEWWRNFWMLSSKYPPLTYIIAAIFQKIFGVGNDSALLTNLLYNAILIVSVYFIGKRLFSPQVGLWGAGISMLFPRLYQTSLQFLLDTPSMTLTVACFCWLTIWKLEKIRSKQWIFTAVFGLFWGLALLTKQSIMFFLFTPLIWLAITYLWQQKWERILQLLVSFIVSAFVWFPWYRTNWIYLFSTISNSNAIPATYEGDPPLNTVAAWTYYWQDLPLAITWILLIVPLVGLLLQLLGKFPKNNEKIESQKAIQSIGWLAIYFIGSYLICSAIFNKDTRYIMSYLPILGIFLAYGLRQWHGKWKPIRWITVGLAFIVMITNLFPIPGTNQITLALSPGVLFRPYLEPKLPNDELIEKVQEINPYQLTNLGVIVNTDFFNHNTFNYYGQLANFQVYGRELGNKTEDIQQDQEYFDWFITKTGDNGFARQPQLDLAKNLETDPNFYSIQTWDLADKSRLKLYHRRTPSVRVQKTSTTQNKVQLNEVIVPAKVPSGFPIPITYQWTGNWTELKSGLLLISWQNKQDNNQVDFWIHDHGIGQGMLYGNQEGNQSFKVIENLAMFPPKNLTNGDYKLKVDYLNRQTGKTYPIQVPDVNITIDDNTSPVPSLGLDLVTRLRETSVNLSQGIKGLDTIFDDIDRINQYDPIQDYLKQAEISLKYRLNNDPGQHELDWNYGLILSQILQEDPQKAIATLKQLIEIAPNNPYHHAYLAFVYLYNWQPKAAEIALKPALEQQPNVKEIQALQGISLLMQGNVIKGWRILYPLL